MIVTRRIAAFFSAWRRITCASVSPFARAVRM